VIAPARKNVCGETECTTPFYCCVRVSRGIYGAVAWQCVYMSQYCDMTPERRKYAVRKASQRRPLLDNNRVNIFPLKRVTTIGHPFIGTVSINTPGQQKRISVAGQWMRFFG
jgi:hypothetical protein